MKVLTKVFDLEHPPKGDFADMNVLAHEFTPPEEAHNITHATVREGGRFFHVVSWVEATTDEEREEVKAQKAALRAQRAGLVMGPRQ